MDNSTELQDLQKQKETLQDAIKLGEDLASLKMLPQWERVIGFYTKNMLDQALRNSSSTSMPPALRDDSMFIVRSIGYFLNFLDLVQSNAESARNQLPEVDELMREAENHEWARRN